MAAARMGYVAGLDGLRGLAAALVVAGHAGVPFLAFGGGVGVELFFVLSGFLITTLLLEEFAATGAVNLRTFYARRARRLLPALFVFLAIVGGAALVVGASAELRGVVAGFTYSTNLWRVNDVGLGSMYHLWSLAVEEHFYLVWPIVIVALRGRPRAVLAVASLAAAASTLWRIHLLDDGASWVRLYSGSDVRISGMLIGGALAVLVLQGLRARSYALGIVGLVAVLTVTVPTFTWGLLAVDAVAVALVLGIVTSGCRWLESTPLVSTGRISYALYLWHVPLLHAFGPWIGVPLSVACAVASMKLIEGRFRRHSVRASDRRDADAAVVIDARAAGIPATYAA